MCSKMLQYKRKENLLFKLTRVVFQMSNKQLRRSERLKTKRREASL